MVEVCKVNEEDLQYAVKKIDYWYKKNIKFLTIITVPFNTPCIFSNIIDEVYNNKCSILYVWGKKRENKELITSIREINSQIPHKYYTEKDNGAKLTFVHYKELKNIHQKYDLIIFDDITYFSKITNAELKKYIDICSEMGERVILYSIERISVIGEKFELAAYNYSKPFNEPRVITTRIDLNVDIPYSLYDYLKWFKDNKNKIAIYVPKKEYIGQIYNYFANKLKLSQTKVVKVEDEDIKKCERVCKVKDRAIFIITNKYEELLEYCYVDNIVVLFSDNDEYTYKDILFICGQIRRINSNMAEVLLVSNTESEDMDKAKNMARKFNKRVWEKQLRTLEN